LAKVVPDYREAMSTLVGTASNHHHYRISTPDELAPVPYWVVERYAHWITKEGRPDEPDRIAKYSSIIEIC
jgi:hypothetical protein